METLTCPSCTQKIEVATKSLPGVDKDSVKVSFNSSKVKLEMDEEQTTIRGVEKAITTVGYDVIKSQGKDK